MSWNWFRRGVRAAAQSEQEPPCLEDIWIHGWAPWGETSTEERKTFNGYNTYHTFVHTQSRSCRACGLAQRREINLT